MAEKTVWVVITSAHTYMIRKEHGNKRRQFIEDHTLRGSVIWCNVKTLQIGDNLRVRYYPGDDPHDTAYLKTELVRDIK